MYIPFVTIFLEEFHYKDYEFEELKEFSEELDSILFEINQSIISGYEGLTEDDFERVMQILDKYRKVSD